MKKHLITLAVLTSLLSYDSFAFSKIGRASCDYFKEEQIKNNEIEDGIDAYCALKFVASQNEDIENRNVLIQFGLGWLMVESADIVTDGTIKEKAARQAAHDLFERQNGVTDKATRDYLKQMSEANAKAGNIGKARKFAGNTLFLLGVVVVFDALFVWDPSNHERSLKEVTSNLIGSFVSEVGDGTLGPKFISSPEKLAEFLEFSPEDAIFYISGSPVLEKFFYQTWKQYKAAIDQK